jgi:cadmium resistance protein CadD (predicted permease)
MSLFTVVMVFIGLNIDTFIALLFVLRNYNYRLPIAGFGAATLFLWGLGVLLGKTLALLFPDWITGLMGIVLILLAVFDSGDEQGTVKTSFSSIFLFCLSLGGDNLAVYIPWVVDLSWTEILYIGIVFEVGAVLLILLGKLFVNSRPVAYLLERYGKYGSKLVYVFAGLYIIWDSKLLPHLIALF